ncbi:hypothetical protein [Acetobacter sp.]|jgi:hypothetical protein|uniref:hypothetical protein n=1 Tax=Acetobacter sp. TaxID=440 RepID=UPI0025B86463|nr:hypothetical protein [Acetobacter sp.]MCH4090525.1 hypothetical protein [Acetobacter sp.]MCI1299219.1 hypothetical protein [Acetobacter sp.]MCI1315766.1 hypothetical protein [Acetobacter sp.]
MLHDLRTNPGVAFRSGFYFVQPKIYNNGTDSLGGECSVQCRYYGKNENGWPIYELTVTEGQGDYYYPYIQTPFGGVGTCIVPKNAPVGTLVLTGAMNGCSLQVNETDSALHFYHDTNGRSMIGKLTPGTVVARVNYSTYAGPGELLNNQSSAEFPANVTYLITVREKDRWSVYTSTFLYKRAPNTSFFGLASASGSKEVFKPVIATPSRLLSSFQTRS